MSAKREFTMVRTIGSGAQGVVWEARSPSGGTVAYKVHKVDPDSSDIATDRQRFTKEIRTQLTLKHPNIVQVIEHGIDVNSEPYYVMELADESLQGRISSSTGGLAEGEALSIFQKVCNAVAHAHTQGIIHRDLKPSNILMYGNDPRVADFGLGRDLTSLTMTHTQSKATQGTLGYMPPEQLIGLHNAEMPADVFALGRILYHMLTGRNPISMDISSVPDCLQFLVHKATRERAYDRYSDAGDLLNSLTSMLGADASTLAPPADQGRAALTAFEGGEPGALQKLIEVFLKFPNDAVLFTAFAPKVPASTLTEIAKKYPADAKSIVNNFDAHAEGNTTFEHADRIVDFLEPFFRNSDDLELRTVILRRLIEQGYQNNRFYVGGKFANMCASVWSIPKYMHLIADLLTEFPTETEFFKPYLQQYFIPETITKEIT
ncbi:serine/threonine-protein kinase [Nocardia sp. NPDC051463]|uniref:serine/threonine protein kinase n=1 Tax=Nocardia sp. NPDC051463 TaxID=3154845 RepID=UPI00344F8B15